MCQHFYVHLDITITRQIAARRGCDQVEVHSDAPTSIRIAASCPDCKHQAVYNANASNYPGTRWPTWLLNRLLSLRAHHAAVQEACLACNVPPASHATWSRP